jgi:hypothetical protein
MAPVAAVAGEDCPLTNVPAVEFADQSQHGPFLIRLKNGMEFYLSPVAPAAMADKFSAFSQEEKAEFFKRRYELLSMVAKALAFPRIAGGIALARDKVRACLGKEKVSIAERLGELTVEKSELDAGKMKKRAQEILTESLQVFDALIWEDASVLVGAKQVSFATILGAGSGLALANRGFYFFGGLQVDVGYNFETQKKFVQFSWLKQTLRGAAILFEQMITVGVLRQYQLDPTVTTQKATHIAVPPVIAYQRGENLVAGGLVLGINAADIGAGYLVSGGDYGWAGALMVSARFLSSISLFWTDLTKTTLYRHEYEKSYADRLKAAWNKWFKGCEEDLVP